MENAVDELTKPKKCKALRKPLKDRRMNTTVEQWIERAIPSELMGKNRNSDELNYHPKANTG